MTNEQMINVIASQFPELQISEDGNGQFSWSFRCSESEELNDEGFETPLEALANFAHIHVTLMDEIMKWRPTSA